MVNWARAAFADTVPISGNAHQMPVVSPLSLQRVELPPAVPGLVAAIEPGSLGETLGLLPGDRIVSVNGHTITDALDFQFHVQTVDRVSLDTVRDSRRRRVDVQAAGDEFWGVTFADPTFDGIRVCENACPFCFIKQIPKGMRRSLYVMDDDYRYSMLYGSFVTLTNLSDTDWARIEEQRVSPMHVSVHAMNPELRVALVGNPKGALISEDLERLRRNRISFHAQLVLCPNVNDGEELDRSVRELAAFDNCLSIAAVPVGLTRHGLERQSKQVRLSRTCMRTLPGKQIEVRRYQADEAARVIDQARAWQTHFREARGETFLYLGDEFYLMCDQAVPDADMYDGYPQIEDGIGITRHMLENLHGFLGRTQAGSLAGAQGIVACGTLIDRTMRGAIGELNCRAGSALEVASIENGFFGSEINISGLLTGSDLLRAFGGQCDNRPLYISSRMISDRTGTLLDDLTLDAVTTALKRPVVSCLTLADVARDLRHRLASPVAA
jgi:putative radical SAM enzyme (TIGR03279 family)